MADRISAVLDNQSGLITRQQLHDEGLAPHDLRRMLRRRELVAVHEGVFVDHTGELTWLQRAWAGVLLAAPAALADESAIRAADGPGRSGASSGPIRLAVDRKRTLKAPSGLTIQRMSHLDDRVLWHTSPPRVRIEHALLDVAARVPSEFRAIATLADGVQSRRTTGSRLRATLAARGRLRRRQFLEAVIADISDGTCSVLEHGYLTRVERPHGLPTASRQARASARGPVYRDVDYKPLRLLVELDGRLFHNNAAARDRDLERDLFAVVDGAATARVGWGQVFERPCVTGELIAILLTQRGWTGTFHRCPACS